MEMLPVFPAVSWCHFLQRHFSPREGTKKLIFSNWSQGSSNFGYANRASMAETNLMGPIVFIFFSWIYLDMLVSPWFMTVLPEGPFANPDVFGGSCTLEGMGWKVSILKFYSSIQLNLSYTLLQQIFFCFFCMFWYSFGNNMTPRLMFLGWGDRVQVSMSTSTELTLHGCAFISMKSCVLYLFCWNLFN